MIQDFGDSGNSEISGSLSLFQGGSSSSRTDLSSQIERLSWQNLEQSKALDDYKEQVGAQREELTAVQNELKSLKGSVDDVKNELGNSVSRSIEIVGLFSAIIAFIVVDVSVIKSLQNFFSAALMIIGLTAGLVLFAVTVHLLFHPGDIRPEAIKVRKISVWILASILFLAGFNFFLKEKNFNDWKCWRKPNIDLAWCAPSGTK
jgi:uncharacterized coiled-coil protein SlyX